MEKKKGLSKSQKICIVSLWILLCIMLFTIPSDNSLGKNIFIAIASGVFVILGVTRRKNKLDKTPGGKKR